MPSEALDLNDPRASPHYVVAVKVEASLDDEKLVTWNGYLAGPFTDFDEAAASFDRCGVFEGEEKAIYSQGVQSLAFPDGWTKWSE